MAIRDEKNGAWEDIEELRIIGDTSASQTAECARAYIDDAWEEVWRANAFIVKPSKNCTIEGENVTIAFSWTASVGNSGGFNIYGDFKAGETYKITITCTVGGGTLYINAGSGESFSSLAIAANNNAYTYLTPSYDTEYLYFYISRSTNVSGSYTGKFTDILVNDVECGYNS